MRKRRFISWLLTLCLLVGAFPIPAYAEGNTTTISGDGTAEQTGAMTITLVIPKKTPAATDLTYTAPSDLAYSGSDKTATVIAKESVTGMGDITVKYYSDEARATVATPANVGTYYVGATVAEGDQYAASTAVLYGDGWTFTITASTPDAPAAPTKASATKNSITLNAVSGCEYSKDGTNWQSGTEFTGLTPGMEYTFYQRIKATANTNASAASSASFSTEADTYAMTITLVIKPAQTIAASDVTATYGDTDKSVSASVTEPTTGGGAITYAVKDGSGDYISVNESTGALTIKAVPPTDGKAYVIVTAAETDDYAEATKEVVVTISKATVTVAAENQSIYVNGTVPDLSAPVLDTHYTVTGLVGEDALTTAPVLAYQKDGSAATPDNTTAGTYDIVASGATASDNYTITYANGTLTISDKGNQTITADDVTVTYGDTDKKVSASVTDPTEGGGAISYAVKDGSVDYIDVDATTGALTIKKVPADGKAYVTVTAAETAAYEQATKDVTVIINKANSTVTKVPEAKTLTYNGSAQELVTAGEAKDGEMQYALGTATEATQPYTTSIPTGTEAGTYYVWYKVNGDENHYDSTPDSVTVTVNKKDVTVDGITASDKSYDGNTTATLDTSNAMFTGKLDGDTLTVTGTGTFDNANVGENKTVTISDLRLDGTGKDNYVLATEGQQATATAAITAKEVGLTWGDTELTYTGVAQKPTATATGLVDGDTCTVIVTGEQTNVGDGYTATAESLSNSNYKLPENKTAAFKIGKAAPPVFREVWKPVAKELVYNGELQELVTAPQSLPEGYQVEYSTNGTDWNTEIPKETNAGDYTVKVRYIGDDNHEGFDGADIPVTIQKGSGPEALTDAQKPVAKENLKYTGEPQDLVTAPESTPTGYTVKYSVDNGITWTETVPKGINAGPYTVKVKYIGDSNHADFDGEDITVTIGKKDAPELTDEQKPAPNTELIYSAEPQELVSKPAERPNGYDKVLYRLSDTEDWKEDVPIGTNAGTYNVQVKYVGDSNHEDFIGATIKVTIEKANVTVTAKNKSKSYGETDPKFEVTVTGLNETDTVEYTVTRAEGENVGTYVITPGGEAAQGNYTVTYQTGTLTITSKSSDNESITAKQKDGETLTYTGEPVKPSIVITDGTDENKKELVEGKDYTVTYVGVEPTVYPGEGGDGTKAPTNAGTYKAVITFKDNYTGTKEVEFTIAKSGQEAPDSGTFTTTNADDAENTNGKIDGFDKEKTYQYSSDDGKTWTDVPKGATSIDVKAGTYKIRFAEDADHEPSEPVKVTVGIASRTQGVVNFNKDDTSGAGAYVETVVEEAKSSNIETFAESQVEEGKDVKVELEITPKKEDDVDKASVTEIGGAVDEVFAGIETESIVTEYLQIDLAKYVDNAKEGNISDTKSPLEIELTYDETKAGNPIVVRTHNGKAKAFGKLNERPKADFKDATYHAANGKIYLYSQYFSDFAIVYSTKKTYYVNVDLGNGETLSQVVGENSKLDLPTGLTKEGFAFGGWYKDAEYNNEWDVDKDTVSSDISIYGKWNKSVTGVKVEDDNVTFNKSGESTKLNVSVIPSDAANKKVTYASSNPKVVTVDENGNITAVANGTATITVTTEDGAKTATVKVTVAIPDVDKKGAAENQETADKSKNTDQQKTTDQQTVEPTKEEKAAISLNAGLKISQTGSKINIKWGKVKEADGYDLYVTYCGESFAHKKPAKTFDKNTTVKATITKINGKKINLKKNFKLYVAAYKMIGGKKEILAKTITGHVVGRKNTKYSNAKNIKITSKTKVSIKQGKTSKIKAKTVLVSKGKKQLSDAHAKEFRYASSNNSIATVDKNGKIKGIAKGTCTIYVYSRNGYAKKVSVIVK